MQELYPEMDGHPEADAPARAAGPEPADEEAELQRLRERIAREMELAELAMQELYPEVTGGEGAGAQDDGTP